MSEKTQSAFWRTIGPGDQLALSDEVTLIDQIKAKQGVLPIPLTVSEVIEVSIQSAKKQLVGEYRIIRLGDQNPWLVAKMVGKEFSLILFNAAQDWSPATRKELMAQDCTFLFQPPGDGREDGWEQGLRYIDEINHDATCITYHIKPQGELTGKVSGEGRVATIVEYMATVEEDEGNGFPQLSVFEIGEADSGLIYIMLGREITSSDVDVVKH